MSLNYLYTPVAVFKLPDLNIREKLLLGLVMSFDKNGLGMSNQTLSEILDVLPTRISEIFKKLESKGYVEIKNAGCKYRKIYLRPNSRVESILLSTESEGRKILPSILTQATDRPAWQSVLRLLCGLWGWACQ